MGTNNDSQPNRFNDHLGHFCYTKTQIHLIRHSIFNNPILYIIKNMNAKKFIIEYTGKTIDQFPEHQFNPYPATAPAWEVLDQNGASRFVGPYQACENFIQMYYQR